MDEIIRNSTITLNGYEVLIEIALTLIFARCSYMVGYIEAREKYRND